MWVLLTRVVESSMEGEARKLGQQSILSCLGVLAHPGVVIVGLPPMPRRGMTWCHSADHGGTVGTTVTSPGVLCGVGFIVGIVVFVGGP